MGRLAVDLNHRVQRFRQKAGNIAYTAGVTGSLTMPQSDYLTSIDVMSNQTVTTGASAPVVSGFGAFGPLGNIAVKVNGSRTPFSLPGFHADAVSKVVNHGYTGPLTSNPIATSSTNQWKNHVRVPLTVDPISELGAWYTGDTTLNMQVSLGGAANTAAVAFSTVNGATIGGSWDIWVEKFNLAQPDITGGWLREISYYYETILQGTYALSNGTTTITLPTMQDYVRIILIFYTGSNQAATFAPADGLYTALDLVANEKFHLIDNIDEQTTKFEMAHKYIQTPQAGVAVIDFMSLFNNRRDVLPTDLDMAKRLILKITSGSSSNNVDVITQASTDSQFAEKWARARAAMAGGKR